MSDAVEVAATTASNGRRKGVSFPRKEGRDAQRGVKRVKQQDVENGSATPSPQASKKDSQTDEAEGQRKDGDAAEEEEEDDEEEMDEEDDEDGDEDGIDESSPLQTSQQPSSSSHSTPSATAGSSVAKKGSDEKKISCLPCREAKVSKKKVLRIYDGGPKCLAYRSSYRFSDRSNAPYWRELSSASGVSDQTRIASSRRTSAAEGQARCDSSRPTGDGSRLSTSSTISRRSRRSLAMTRRCDWCRSSDPTSSTAMQYLSPSQSSSISTTRRDGLSR